MAIDSAENGSGVVLTIGETLMDLIVSDGADSLLTATALAVREGGAPANVAVALARLGVPSGFCGVVGADPFGDRLRALLAREGVDVSRLRQTPEAATSLAFAWKDARGDGHFRLLRLADRLLSDDDIARAGIESAGAIVVGSVALAAEPSRTAIHTAVTRAVRADVSVVFDVNARPTLWRDRAEAFAACEPVIAGATVLKLSLDDARWLFGVGNDLNEVARVLASLPPRIVVLTDGARGCWGIRRDTAPIFVPAFAVAAVEPTGAGDAFTAALVSRFIQHGWSAPTEDDLCFAAAAGALATTRPGALDGLPTLAELEAFLSAHFARADD